MTSYDSEDALQERPFKGSAKELTLLSSHNFYTALQGFDFDIRMNPSKEGEDDMNRPSINLLISFYLTIMM